MILVEVYNFYDKPVLFACRNASDSLFLVVWEDENDEYDTWLYVGLSDNRFNHIRSGAIDLHTAFSEPEDGVIFELRSLHNREDQTEIRFLQPDQIETDRLPLPGEALDLDTQTLP